MIHFGLFSQRPRNIETLIFLVNLVRRRRTMAKTVSPGVQALRKVVEDVYADARKAKAEGKLVGWASS